MEEGSRSVEASQRLELGLSHSCNRIFPVALLGSHHVPYSQSAGCAAWLCLLPRSLAALLELKPWLQALFTMPVLGALTQPVHFQPGTNSSAMTPSIRQWLTGHLHLCSDLPICRGVTGESGPAQDSTHSGSVPPLQSTALFLGNTKSIPFQQARQQRHLSFHVWANSHSPRRQSRDMLATVKQAPCCCHGGAGLRPGRQSTGSHYCPVYNLVHHLLSLRDLPECTMKGKGKVNRKTKIAESKI